MTLPEVDEVSVITLVDNVFDGLLASGGAVTRPALGSTGHVPAPQFTAGETAPGLRAEHGFSALVTVRRGDQSTTLLFDTGVSPDGLAVNARSLGLALDDVQGVVLSHGHFDHAGGFPGLARLRGRSGLPLTVHPAVWTRRRLALPGGVPFEMPTLSPGALEREGFEVIERRQPSLLAGGSILITGEVDRTTEFERGMPPAHQAWDGHQWRQRAGARACSGHCRNRRRHCTLGKRVDGGHRHRANSKNVRKHTWEGQFLRLPHIPGSQCRTYKVR